MAWRYSSFGTKVLMNNLGRDEKNQLVIAIIEKPTKANIVSVAFIIKPPFHQRVAPFGDASKE